MARNESFQHAIVVCLVLAIGCGPAYTKVIYVDDDANGLNDGTSWTNAYKFLQDALAEAESAEKPVQVRVAQGTYKPDEGSGQQPHDRSASFPLYPGVSIWGGFAGCGSADPNEQNAALYQTILSGDLVGNDAESQSPTDLPRYDNSHHVVRCTAGQTSLTTELGGCTVIAGQASNNETESGGGLYIRGARKVLIQNCVITHCYANESGGGMCITATDDITILQCTFVANQARTAGGGLRMDRSNGCLIGCTFEQNRADEQAGATLLLNCGLTLANNTFRANTALTGGAVRLENSRAVFLNSTFQDNSATWGGAVASKDRTDLTLARCHLRGNQATAFGGAIWCEDTTLTLTNNTLCGNAAGEGGGGIRTADSRLYATNCTSAGNRAPQGAFLLSDASARYGGRAEIDHCIIAEEDNSLWNRHCPLTIQYTNLPGGQAGVDDTEDSLLWGPGNVDVASRFADPGYWDGNDTPDDPNDDVWIDGDYHLKSQAGRWDATAKAWVADADSSECIDAGDAAAVTRYEPSPNGYTLNLGAYGGTPEASKSHNVGGETDTEKRFALLQQLLDSADDPFSPPLILVRTGAGYLRYLSAECPGGYVIQGVQGRKPEETALAFADRWRDILIRNTPAVDFQVNRISRSDYATVIRVGQTYAGLPVYAATMIIEVGATDSVESLLTDHLRDAYPLEDQPNLLAPSINALTAKHIGEAILSQTNPGQTYVASEATLMIYDPAIISLGGAPCPAWYMRVDPTQGSCGKYMLIDAQTGELLLANPMCLIR
ncbi:MAG: right-handed parallel beta-helix repeat-containing protein [Sedimentisphaerales bacterium]|nr:right-handed parallel beta-helix repeat-containing protein [Sedimentisphaerales bacterium]